MVANVRALAALCDYPGNIRPTLSGEHLTNSYQTKGTLAISLCLPMILCNFSLRVLHVEVKFAWQPSSYRCWKQETFNIILEYSRVNNGCLMNSC